MKETKLTKDWSEFIPSEGYEKQMQDVRLKNGDEITMCWPNAGFWNVCQKEGNERYYQKDIPVTETTHVRLTHSKKW